MLKTTIKIETDRNSLRQYKRLIKRDFKAMKGQLKGCLSQVELSHEL